PVMTEGQESASIEELRAELAWERRARLLLQAIARQQMTTAEGALDLVVGAVCRATGWPVGHALVRRDDGRFESAGAWHVADDARYEPLREATRLATFGKGEGLPGRVAETKRAAWIIDVRSDPNFPRRIGHGDLAVRAAFGFPVVVKNETVAVLEFFS